MPGDWFDTQMVGWGGPQTIQGPSTTPPPVNTTPGTATAGGFSTGSFTGGGTMPLASVQGPGLMQPWTTPFVAPNAQTVMQDPGVQFRQDQGQQGIERAAAAHGTLLSGGTLKDLAGYQQGLASQEYSNAYNRALSEWQNAQNLYFRNSDTQFNRLNQLSSSGQNAAAGQANAAQNYGTSAGNLITGQGNALAAGQIGGANAWSNGISNIGNTIGDLWAMQRYSGYGQQPSWNNPSMWDGVGTNNQGGW